MYQIEVKLEEEAPCGHGTVKVWRAIRPTGGKPYEYESRPEAEAMARMCYGSADVEVRVKGV